MSVEARRKADAAARQSNEKIWTEGWSIFLT